MGFDAGDSNLYRYVNNRPTYETDPSGLLTILVHGVNSEGGWYGDVASGLIKYYQGNGNTNNGHWPAVIGFYWKTNDNKVPPLADATNDFTKLNGNLQYQEDRAKDLKSLVTDLRLFLDNNGSKDEPINIVAHSQGTIITLRALQMGAKVDNVILLGSPFDTKNNRSKDISDAAKSIAKGATLYNFYCTADRMVMAANGGAAVKKWQGQMPDNVKQPDFTNHARTHLEFVTKKNAENWYGKYTTSPNPKSIQDPTGAPFKKEFEQLQNKYNTNVSIKLIVK